MEFSTRATTTTASSNDGICPKTRHQPRNRIRPHIGLVDVTNQPGVRSNHLGDWAGSNNDNDKDSSGNHHEYDSKIGFRHNGDSDSLLFPAHSDPTKDTLHERRQLRQRQQRQYEQGRNLSPDLEHQHDRDQEHKQDHEQEASKASAVSFRGFRANSDTIGKNILAGIYTNTNTFRVIRHAENSSDHASNRNKDQGTSDSEQPDDETGENSETTAMPPPSHEMTHRIIRQRREGIHDLRFSRTGSLAGETNYLVARLSDGTPIYSSLSCSHSDSRSQYSLAAVEQSTEENDEETVRQAEHRKKEKLFSSETFVRCSIEQDPENDDALLFAVASDGKPLAQEFRTDGTSYVANIQDSGSSDYGDIQIKDQHYTERCVECETAGATAADIGQHGVDVSSKPSQSIIHLAMRPSISPITTPSDCDLENENNININIDNDNDNDNDNTETPESKREQASGFTTNIRKRNRCEEESISDETKVEEPDNDNDGNNSSNRAVVRFKDIIGHQSVKLRLDEVLLPLALPTALSNQILKGIRSLPASILFYGPPGCGKTQLARALAGEADAAFLSIGPSDILSKYVGESEAAVRSVFGEALRMARDNGDGNKCTVLFFDEIDALGQSRGQGSGGFGSNNNSGNQRGATMGSGTSGGTGGDNPSRRVLAELLIQLNKVNASYGAFDSREIANNGQDDANGNAYPSTSSPEEDCVTEHDWNEEEHSYDGDNSMRASGDPRGCRDEGGAMPDDDCGRVPREQGGGARNSEWVGDDRGVRIIVVAATNRPEDCDPALIRRFAIQVPVGLPTAKDRKKILKENMKDIEHTIDKRQFSQLALVTDGWSGSDLQSLAREAAMAPVRECIRRAALLKRRKQFQLSSTSVRGTRKKKRENQRRPTRDISIGDVHQESSARHSRKFCPATNKREVEEDGDDGSSFDGAQKQLLEEFRNLRPVGFLDYTRALTLWFSRMYDNVYDSPLAEYGLIEESEQHDDTGSSSGASFWNEHYDSSSDEDEDDDNEDDTREESAALIPRNERGLAEMDRSDFHKQI